MYRPVPAANEVFRRLVSPFMNIIFLRVLYLPYIFLLCKQGSLKIITEHTGWTDDLDFAFRHIDKVCNSLVRQKPHDPDAPYDGHEESEDTEENAKTALASASLFPCELAISSRLFSDKSIA